jgi:hypothetical protein
MAYTAVIVCSGTKRGVVHEQLLEAVHIAGAVRLCQQRAVETFQHQDFKNLGSKTSSPWYNPVKSMRDRIVVLCRLSVVDSGEP